MLSRTGQLFVFVPIAALAGCNQAPTPIALPASVARYQVIVMPLMPPLANVEVGLDRWVRLDVQTGEMQFCTANSYVTVFRSACRKVDAPGLDSANSASMQLPPDIRALVDKELAARQTDGPNSSKSKCKNQQDRLPSTDSKGWTLMRDANGRRAYVSPDGKNYDEVRCEPTP